MHYKDYQNARDAAWQILIDCNVDRLPLQISGVCRALGVRVLLHEPEDGNDGRSFFYQGTPTILVSKRVPVERQRFTTAHELGHILLGHVGKYELCNREPSPTDNPIEQAANVFASRLLAPACVLWGCDAWEPEEIAKICGISRQAAGFRAERMALLRERGKFLMSPLERQVYAQFEAFIRSQLREAGPEGSSGRPSGRR